MATFVLLVTSFVTLFQHIQGDCDPGGECDVPYPYSSWECAEGSAWPPHFCRFSQLQLVCGDNPSFVLVTNGTQELPHSFLGIASEFNISVVDTAPQVSNGGVVKQIGDPVFVFTFYYYPPLHRNGGSNLFHLHVDTLIPVFGLLEQLGHVDNMLNRKSGHLLAPAVEVSRLGGITWHHTAHRDPGSYWNLLLASLSDLPLKPLVASSWCTGVDSVTVQQAFFGSPAQHTRRNWTPRFIHRYVNFMLSRLGVRGPSSKETRDLTSVGLIVRSGRRKILNRAQLKEATEQQGIALHFLHFEKMTPADQLRSVQQHAVIVGMNGAGLMNCLFAPENTVCVQLVPWLPGPGYLNWEEFGRILSLRGPYAVWRNPHQHNHYQTTVPVLKVLWHN